VIHVSLAFFTAGHVVVVLVSTAAGHVWQATQHVMQPGMASIAQRHGVLA
jgi:hypothetical protein